MLMLELEHVHVSIFTVPWCRSVAEACLQVLEGCWALQRDSATSVWLPALLF